MIKYDDLFPKKRWEISEQELSEQLKRPCKIICFNPVQTAIPNSRPRPLRLLIQDKKDKTILFTEKKGDPILFASFLKSVREQIDKTGE